VEIGCGRVAITATPGGGRGHLASLHWRYVRRNHLLMSSMLMPATMRTAVVPTHLSRDGLSST